MIDAVLQRKALAARTTAGALTTATLPPAAAAVVRVTCAVVGGPAAGNTAESEQSQPSGGESAMQIDVRLLGPTRIACAGVGIESHLSAQTLRLIALLVCRQNDRLTREDVAFALWPDCPEAEARANLRRHLYRLQQALPPAAKPWIAADKKTLRWSAAGETSVDALEFERLSKSPASMEAAIELYRGDFLPLVDDEWAGAIRERLRRRWFRCLEEAIRRCRDETDELGMLRYVELLLKADPWREDALRELMLLRYRLGDRAGALSYFRDFSGRLKSEFDADPMPETVRCRELIARGAQPHDGSGFEAHFRVA
jgi:DNA-binding SARP family transcriptional activator